MSASPKKVISYDPSREIPFKNTGKTPIDYLLLIPYGIISAWSMW